MNEEEVCKVCGCQATAERQADGSYVRVFGCLCASEVSEDQQETQ